MLSRRLLAVAALLAWSTVVQAMPPGASYIFPAGGQRGQTVKVRVGGLCTHDRCPWEMLGTGVVASKELTRGTTLWFEGPRLPLPESQRVEDYPQDMLGEVKIAATAPLGMRAWRLWTAQGITPSKRFVIGDLPEIVEDETDDDAVAIKLPVTINGRIFPREDSDAWKFTASQGQSITCAVQAETLGSPLDARLEIVDRTGKVLADNEDFQGLDPLLRFVAPADGLYQVRIHDVRFQGSQAHVYRLTVTADPFVERVYPLGARCGTKIAVELSGQGLSEQPVMLDIPAKATVQDLFTVEVGGKRTQPFTLDLDELPEFLAESARARPVTAPAVLNGRIDKSGAVDVWSISAKKGERLHAEMRAARLGSPLNGVLTLTDASGKVLVKAEANDGRDDPLVRFTVPADGTYLLRVNERYRGRGSAAHAYRVRLTTEEPDFQLSLASDALTVLREGQTPFRILVERRGDFKQPITLAIAGLPEDVKVAPLTIQPNQNQVDVIFKADKTARVRVARLTIQGSATVGTQSMTRTALVPGTDHVALAVGVPTPFKVVGEYQSSNAPRGSVQKRKYQIERNGYTGPITVALAERQARHLQGATGPVLTLPATTREFEYPVTLPPWMEIGRTCRVCIQATGVVQDADGTKHTVCFSSTNQNEQYVTVIATGRLDVVLDHTSIAVKNEDSVRVGVRVARDKGLQGAVKVELVGAGAFPGLRCIPLTIQPDAAEGVLILRFVQGRLPTRTHPFIVRATLNDPSGPYVAETTLEVTPP